MEVQEESLQMEEVGLLYVVGWDKVQQNGIRCKTIHFRFGPECKTRIRFSSPLHTLKQQREERQSKCECVNSIVDCYYCFLYSTQGASEERRSEKDDGGPYKEQARDGEREGHAGSPGRSTAGRVRTGPVRSPHP